MNTKTVSSPVTKVIAIVVFAVAFFLINPLSGVAGGIKDKKPATLNEEQVSVKYVGSNENSVIFHVELENPTAAKFWLIIKNDAGDVVYNKAFSDTHFSKSVYFPKEEASGDMHPTFVIRNGNNEVVRQFSVNRTLVESTVVTKL